MTTCATPAELLLVMIADPQSGASDEWSDHIRSCGTCRARLHELQERTASLAASHRGMTAHLNDISFAEVAGASLMSELADPEIVHLTQCEQCRREQAEIVMLLRDPLVRAELNRGGPPALVAGGARVRVPLDRTSRGRRPYLVRIAATGLAAAAALLITVRVVRWHGPDVAAPAALRHATIDIARAPQPIAPLGDVGHVDAMAWTSVPHADLYRVSIFDGRGRVVWETEVSDTTATPPVRLLEQSPGELRWRVKARTSFDQWVDSDFAEFSLKGDR